MLIIGNDNYEDKLFDCLDKIDQITNKKLYEIAPYTEPIEVRHGLFESDSDVIEKRNFVLRINFIYVLLLMLIPVIFCKGIKLLYLKVVFALSVILYGLTVGINYGGMDGMSIIIDYLLLPILVLSVIYFAVIIKLHKKYHEKK